jgi:hypothetical protein
MIKSLIHKSYLDSHKSNTIDIFSLKKPISILRKPNEKNILF